MTFNEYQKTSRQTAIYPPEHGVIYPALGLASEAGEVAGKVKKALRDDQGKISEQRREKIKDELGDVLWYVAQLATDLNLDMEEVAAGNIGKLQSRKDRGTLSGSGDDR